MPLKFAPLFVVGAALCAARAAGALQQPAPDPAAEKPACDASAGPCPSPSDDEQLKKELEEALGKQKTKAGAAGQGASTQGAAAPAGSAAGAAAQDAPPDQPGAAPTSLPRGSQSLNPDISAIVDADFGFERRGVSYRSGDDPDLGGTSKQRGAGPGVQEVELALSAVVDPYFKGEVYLTIPNLSGIEVEEAFATTTSLPANLQVKAGSFRSAFGRQNGQHLHVQDFTRRPLLNAAFLGVDGLRGPAVQVSWLSPLPFFLTLTGEVRSSRAPDAPADGADPGPVASFGGGKRTDLTYVGAAKAFFPLGEEWSMYAGLNGATGVSPGFLLASNGTATPGAGRRAYLVGGDLYLKYKPSNVSGGYTSLAWQSEAIFRHLEDASGLPGEWDGGLYSQIVWQFARRWFLGVRGDLIGIPASAVLAKAERGSLSLTFQASEFARVRGYLEAEHASGSHPIPGADGGFDPLYVPANPSGSFAGYVQLEISIGAHGAHPF